MDCESFLTNSIPIYIQAGFFVFCKQKTKSSESVADLLSFLLHVVPIPYVLSRNEGRLLLIYSDSRHEEEGKTMIFAVFSFFLYFGFSGPQQRGPVKKWNKALLTDLKGSWGHYSFMRELRPIGWMNRTWGQDKKTSFVSLGLILSLPKDSTCQFLFPVRVFFTQRRMVSSGWKRDKYSLLLINELTGY